MNDEHRQDEFDVERLHLEAHSEPRSPDQHWAVAAKTATLIVRGLPGSRVTAGQPGRGRSSTDYITPYPNPPMTVFGPNGEFIVRFLQDGSWIDSTGRTSQISNFIEGSYEAIANQLIRDAGLGAPIRRPRPGDASRSRAANGSAFGRLLKPEATTTWRDDYPFPSPPHWGTETPPSICLQSDETRLILTSYDPHSCTYTAGYAEHARWGVESLRIPVIPDTALQDGSLAAPEPIHTGDCLVTLGPKFEIEADQPELTSQPATHIYMWHPQRVLHVESEGPEHIRVWLVVDHDVANACADPDDVVSAFTARGPGSQILSGHDRQAMLARFHLSVFCSKCGARGELIVYGLPGPNEPPYVSLGGCLVEEGQPDYVCACGHSWSDPLMAPHEGKRAR